MHVAVLGAGVVGLTTAFALVEKGHRVTVVDRQAAAGRETSYGNGAQLSYAFVDPLASKATLARLPTMLVDREGPLRVDWSLAPDFIRWGLDFIRACNDTAQTATIHAQLDLAALSRAELMRITEAQSLSYGLRQPGKLIIYRTAAAVEAAQRQAEAFGRLGIEQQVLTPARCMEVEPALRLQPGELKGALFTPSEQVANCAEFCTQLAAALERTGMVTWRLETVIDRPVVEANRIVSVRTSGAEVEADAFVLSMGTEAARFARRAGFRAPIQPLKGYSLTSPVRASGQPLSCSITDPDHKTVFAPLEIGGSPRVRVAGMAHLGSHDTRLDADSLDRMRKLGASLFNLDPDADDQPWAGLRPTTPNSRPIIGRSPLANLYLNAGHGGLGWTLSAGSARLCAEIVSGETPAIPTAPYELSAHV